jgi:hypothetical protein
MATTKKKRVVNASGKRPVKKVATASTGAVMKKKRRTKRPASIAGTWFGKMGREKQKQYTDKHPTSIFSRKSAAKKAPLDKEMDGLRRLEDKLHNLAKQHDEVSHQVHKDMAGKRMQKKKLGDLYEKMAEVRSHIRAAKQDIARKKAA